MAPQIQRARAALRAIHRMDALMRASHVRDDIEARPDNTLQDAEDDLRQPLLGTDAEAVASDVRTSRPNTSTGKKA